MYSVFRYIHRAGSHGIWSDGVASLLEEGEAGHKLLKYPFLPSGLSFLQHGKWQLPWPVSGPKQHAPSSQAFPHDSDSTKMPFIPVSGLVISFVVFILLDVKLNL